VKITEAEIQRIKNLRETGHSLPEIMRKVERGSSTVHKYIFGVAVLPEFKEILERKRGANTYRARVRWEEAGKEARNRIDHLTSKEKLLIAACLYWGEGTKSELSLTNSDPLLIRAFVLCLQEFGVTSKELRVSIRVYEDLEKEKCATYWARILGIPRSQVLSINVLRGKKTGKLPFGMCRIRVTKGQKTFKLLQSIIKVIDLRLKSL